MRKIAGIALCVLGLIVAIAGFATGILGKSDGEAKAVAKGGSTPYVYTAPGVLDAADSKVKVRVASVDGSNVTVAFGTSQDVEAWVKGVKATRITGLKSWKELATKISQGTVEGIPALKDSDMWLETKTGGKVVEAVYDVNKPGAISLIATTDKGKAPEVSLTWQLEEKRPTTVPVMVIGVLLALLGVVLLVLAAQDGRRRKERLAVRERKEARRAARAGAATTVLPSAGGSRGRDGRRGDESGRGHVGGPRPDQGPRPDRTTVMDRSPGPDRAFRPPEGSAAPGFGETARADHDTATGHAFGAGVLAASPRSEELRNRDLSAGDRLVLNAPGGSRTPIADGGDMPFPELDETPTADGIPTISEAASAALLGDGAWQSRWRVVDDEEPDPREADDDHRPKK